MSFQKLDHFPIEPDRLSLADAVVVEVGNSLLDGVPIDVQTLDAESAVERAAMIDLAAARKINPKLPYYQADLAQKSIHRDAEVRLPYDRGFVESAAASVASATLMSKNMLRRMFRGTYEEAGRTRERFSSAGLEVGIGMTVMRREVILPVSNLEGDFFHTKIEQLAMDGTITVGDETVAFEKGELATSMSFYRNPQERANGVFAVSTADPSRLTWGETFEVPGNRLLYPGQERSKMPLSPLDFPVVLATIQDQQL